MPLYIVVNSDGTQQRVSTQPLVAGEGETLVVDATRDVEPSSATHLWDAATRVYVEREDDSRFVFSRGDWMAMRVGLDKEVALRAARLNESSPLSLRATIETLEAELERRAFVDVRHDSTVSAASNLAAILVQIGAVAADQQATYAASLLAPKE